MMPTEEEKARIIEAQTANNEMPLGTAEQFLLTLGSISELPARLNLWLYKLDYEGIESVGSASLIISFIYLFIDKVFSNTTYTMTSGLVLNTKISSSVPTSNTTVLNIKAAYLRMKNLWPRLHTDTVCLILYVNILTYTFAASRNTLKLFMSNYVGKKMIINSEFGVYVLE